MAKKAEEFLLDTKLGEKTYELEQKSAEGETMKLNIESGSVPVAILRNITGRAAAARRGIGLFKELDEKFQALFGIKAKDLAIFFRLLAVMINAGVPLMKSLEVIGVQTKNARLRVVIFEIRGLIEKGGTLSGSMAQYAKIFDESHIGMVRSGEASGSLNSILNDLATDVEKAAAIQRKVKGALMYPVFILFVLVGVIIAMMLFVVPKISEAFSNIGQDLPVLTQVLITTSNWLRGHIILFLTGVLAVILGIVFGKRTYTGKRIWDRCMIYIPLFGQLMRKTILARFARSLGNLLRSGIPIIEALKINAKGLGNTVYSERVLFAAEDLSRGIPLGESLIDSPLFPDMMVQMIGIGEQTAQLDGMSDKIAAYYEEEVDVAVSGLTKILEPLIIVLVGGVVGSLVGAIMLPLIKFSEMASGL